MALTPERREELAKALARMRYASDMFYALATGFGVSYPLQLGSKVVEFGADVHTWIEFTGLLNEYLDACTDALAQGIDFAECSTHSGQALPLARYRRDYLREKLDCIFPGIRLTWPDE